MSKGGFSNIVKKKKTPTPEQIEAFANDAKVDGDKPEVKKESQPTLDPNARRGKAYKNKAGDKITLTGKVQEIPLNEYELKILQEAASRSSLSLTTYIRSVAMNDANRILNG